MQPWKEKWDFTQQSCQQQNSTKNAEPLHKCIIWCPATQPSAELNLGYWFSATEALNYYFNNHVWILVWCHLPLQRASQTLPWPHCLGLLSPCVHSPPLRFDCPLPSFHMQISCWFLFWRVLFLVLKSWLSGVQPCCVLIAAGRWIRAHSDGCEMPLRDRNGRTMDYFTMKSPETDADSHVEETSWGAWRHKAIFCFHKPHEIFPAQSFGDLLPAPFLLT